MTAARGNLPITLSVTTGLLLGVHLAVWGTGLVAWVMGESAFHQRHYGVWMVRLLITLPIAGATFLGFLAWRRRWERLQRILWWTVLPLSAAWMVVAVLL